LPLKIFDQAAFQQKVLLEESIQSMYFGALLILGIYNFLVYLSSRLTFFAGYVVFLAGYGTFQAAFGGQWHYYDISSSPLFSDYVLVQGMNLISIGLTTFVLNVFELRNYRRLKTIWQRAGYFILIISGVNLIAVHFTPYYSQTNQVCELR
jgi:hypothetical protein